MGEDFFVKLEGDVQFRLVHRDLLEEWLNKGIKPEKIYRCYEEVHSMTFGDEAGTKPRLFVFI